MSAYICDDSVFSTIYSGMIAYARPLSDPRNTDQLVKTMQEWKTKNIEAVQHRYNGIENLPRTIGQDDKVKLTFNPNVPIHQLLKSLDCLHYQMSEGDIPQSLEYIELENYIKGLEKYISRNDGRYENAKW